MSNTMREVVCPHEGADLYFTVKRAKQQRLLPAGTERPNKENITASQRAHFDLPDSQLTGFGFSGAGFKPTLIHNKSPPRRGRA